MGIHPDLKVVADIGQNHNGSIEEAHRLIDAAAAAGVWAVKGQKRSEIRPEWDRPYDSPYSYGKTYAEHRAALEFTIHQHCDLALYAEARGLVYFVSAFDRTAAEEACTADFAFLKLPSALLTDQALHGLLYDRPEFNPDIIISTGMASLTDIRTAITALNPAYVLQCTSAYPCPPKDVNLRVMMDLADWVDTRVGFSSHSLGIHIELAAAILGAQMIEVHITMDRAGKGRDHAFSKEPGQLQKMMRNINQCFEALGSWHKEMLVSEVEAAQRLGRKIPDHLR